MVGDNRLNPLCQMAGFNLSDIHRANGRENIAFHVTNVAKLGLPQLG